MRFITPEEVGQTVSYIRRDSRMRLCLSSAACIVEVESVVADIAAMVVLVVATVVVVVVMVVVMMKEV